TAQGMLVGTLQYMSPEQLEGKDVDARSDIFGFGTVLYEMITGHPAFIGKSKASLIAAILSSEPPAISSVRPLSPPALDGLVKSCLTKEPEERWQTAHDLKLQLQWVQATGSQTGALPPVVKHKKGMTALAWTLAAALAVGLALATIVYLRVL